MKLTTEQFKALVDLIQHIAWRNSLSSSCVTPYGLEYSMEYRQAKAALVEGDLP